MRDSETLRICIRCEDAQVEDDNIKCMLGKSYPNKCPKGKW